MRPAISRRIHCSGDEGLRLCASTLTDWKPYTASMIGGRYSDWGSARENPAVRSGLHCICVRTASRECGCGTGTQWHRRAHAVPVAQKHVVAHADFVAVIQDRRADRRKQQNLEKLDVAPVAVPHER